MADINSGDPTPAPSTTSEVQSDTANIAVHLRRLIAHCGKAIVDASDAQARMDELLDRIAPLVPGDDHDSRYHEFETSAGDIVAVVGDLHGDYRALEAILLEVFPPEISDREARRRRLVFLGDLLDRGPRDLQVLHLVVRLAELLPGQVILLRGNHEEFEVGGGQVRCTAASNATYFTVKYGETVGYNRLVLLDHYLRRLPHFVIMDHPRGRVGFVHAGVPPEFLEAKCESPREYLEVTNIRRSFLWGRPAPPGSKRPGRPYPFDTFYAEDVEHFCRRNDLKLILRGHDTASRGYDRLADGLMLTVFSSGAAAGSRGDESAYAGAVDLPRYILLEHDTLFREAVDHGEHEGLDAGIGVKEVHTKDVVVFLDDEDLESDDAVMLGVIGRWICDRLVAEFGWPLHLVSRATMRERGLADHEVVPASAGSAVDLSLDQSPTGRLHYVLGLWDGELRWSSARDDGAVCSEQYPVIKPVLADFARLCIEQIGRDAEIEGLVSQEPLEDDA